MNMKKIVLTFGLISGAIAAVLMGLTLLVVHRIGFDHGFLFGYAGIIASLLPVYFGIRAYREQAGALTFGRGFAIGLLISLVSTVCYIVAWQVIYFNFWPDFMDQWAAHAVAQAQASGATAEAVAELRQQMAGFKEAYDNPLTNAAYTFLEPFPVGLLVSLVSAAVLRRKAAGG